MENTFDFYYGLESDQFTFFRIPKMFIKDPMFKGLSCNAMFLYGLLLDRMALSMKNHWVDEKNRVFIIYTIEEIMEDLNLSRGTCIKTLKELDTEYGIGLIERRRLGFGKPNCIYVKNFMSFISARNNEKTDENLTDKDNNDDKINKSSISSKIELQEVQNLDFKKSKNCTSRSLKNELQEVQILDANNTDNSNTDYSKTYISNTDMERDKKLTIKREKSDNLSIHPSIYPSVSQDKNIFDNSDPDKEERKDCDRALRWGETEEPDSKNDLEKTRKDLESKIWKRLGIDSLIEISMSGDIPLYEEMYRIVCDVLMYPKRTMKIGKTVYPYQAVREAFMTLGPDNLYYVAQSMKSVKGQIKNMYSYLVSSLFHSTLTVRHYMDYGEENQKNDESQEMPAGRNTEGKGSGPGTDSGGTWI